MNYLVVTAISIPNGILREGRKSALILLSGGLDSAACAHFLKAQGYEVSGFFVDYGQVASVQEKLSADRLAKYFDIPMMACRVTTTLSFSEGEIQGRNAFLTLSGLMFSGITNGLICLGIHSGTPYYDCSQGFFKDLSKVIAAYSDGRISLFAPFIDWNKADVINYFMANKLPLELTYSCERGSEPPCGVCASCRDRGMLCVSR